MSFNITKRDKRCKARIGKLRTKSREIETPFFMPVATHGTAKYVDSSDLERIGTKATISNALILSLTPGTKVLTNFKELRNFMSFNGICFTDSGGFQMYSDRIYLGSNDRGVYFRDHYSGQKIFMTPEENMDLQINLGAEVAMCLDSMPLYEHSEDSIKEAIRKTTLWGKRCKETHDKLQRKKKKDERQLLFGICQGGIYEDLRSKSTKELVEMNFDGYAIGGLALGEPKEAKRKMVELVKDIVPENKIVYLMGVGDPLDILEAISQGVDVFDSRLPTRNARNGSLFTSKGTLRIRNAKYRNDKDPIDKNCSCDVCKKYSKAFIRQMIMLREGTGLRLTSIHNLFFINNLLIEAKNAIKKGKYLEFYNKFKINYKK